LDENCIQGDSYKVSASELYTAYADNTGSTMSQHKFGKRLQAIGYRKIRNSEGRFVYLGIGLRG
jgi:hypothetical protein